MATMVIIKIEFLKAYDPDALWRIAHHHLVVVIFQTCFYLALYLFYHLSRLIILWTELYEHKIRSEKVVTNHVAYKE